ncbi:MAG TPA: hypothetical protein VGE68_02125 [Sphingomicrobium sp.]
MRAILLLLILAVVVLIVAFATGMLDITQRRPAQVPNVSVTSNGVVAKGGQAPAFDVETGTVSVGTKDTNVSVPAPSVTVNRAGNDVNAVTNNAQ